MKKILFTALVAALFVTSCNKTQEIIANSEEDAVSFSVYASRAVTKGGSIGLDDLQAKGFGVFAFYTKQQTFNEYITDNPSAKPNFMDNQQVTFDGNGKWVYSPLKFWPNTKGEKISFFAYAPYEAGKEWTATTTHFTVDSLVKNHIDFLYAQGQTDRTRVGYKDSIQFNFKHTLSKIGFNVAYLNDTTLYDVDKRSKIDTTQTYVVIDSVILQPKHTGFYKEGDIDLVSSTGWTPVAGSYFKSFKLSAKENFKDTTSASERHPFGQIVLDSLVQLNRDDSYLMILPQDFTTTDSLDIIVNYHVWTKDANIKPDGYVKIPNNVTTNHKIKFEQGNQYTFNILVGLTTVKVKPTVDSWSSASPIDVNAPVVVPSIGD